MVKSVLRNFGLAIYRIPTANQKSESGYSYAASNPNATLAPWLDDEEFMRVFEKAKNNTLVDIYRMYELWTLVEETAKIGGDIIEVGVWRGGSGCLMAARAQSLEANTKVYLCDTFEGVVKASEEDSKYDGGEHKDTSIDIVKSLQKDLGVDNIQILTGIFPDDTGDQLDASRIRLCHIDVDVYQSAKDTVEYIWDRMPAGAVIVFDDYGFVGCDGITRYVNQMRERDDVFYFNNLNGHAVLIKQEV